MAATSGSTRGSRRTPSGSGREREGLGTAQEIFDFFYNDFIPDDHPWWQITIGDPGPDLLFEFPVYFRGAMTLHQLRLAVGDDDFFRILRAWAQSRAGDNVTTREFIRLAERISRAAARRPVPDLAVHAGQASATSRGAGCLPAIRADRTARCGRDDRAREDGPEHAEEVKARSPWADAWSWSPRPRDVIRTGRHSRHNV